MDDTIFSQGNKQQSHGVSFHGGIIRKRENYFMHVHVHVCVVHMYHACISDDSNIIIVPVHSSVSPAQDKLDASILP